MTLPPETDDDICKLLVAWHAFELGQGGHPVIDFNLPDLAPSGAAPYTAREQILEDLIATHGRDEFQRFLLAYINDPDHFRESFRKEYGISIAAAVSEIPGGR